MLCGTVAMPRLHMHSKVYGIVLYFGVRVCRLLQLLKDQLSASKSFSIGF